MKIDDLVGVARAMEEPNFIVVNKKNRELSTIKKFLKRSQKKPILVGRKFCNCEKLTQKFLRRINI
jgi:tripartite-type tricarboxylate transporter receptor subunit TctC